MNKIYLYLISYAFLLISQSCHETKNESNENKIIRLSDLRPCNLSEIASNAKVVSPKWPDTILISGITKIKQLNNKLAMILNGNHGTGVGIYGLDDNKLNLFFNRGNGPGQYPAMNDIAFSDNYFYVLCRTAHAIFVYDHSFNYVKTIAFPGLFVSAICLMDEYLYMYSGNEINEWNSKLHILDSKTEKFIGHYFKNKTSRRFINIHENINFQKFDNKIIFRHAFNDTIYTIDRDKTINVRHWVDFGASGINNDVWNKEFSDVYTFRMYLRNTDYSYFVMNYYEGNIHEVFNYQRYDNYPVVIVNKNTGVIKSISRLYDDVYSMKYYEKEELLELFTKKILFEDDKLLLIGWPQDVEYEKFSSNYVGNESNARSFYKKNNPCFIIYDLLN